MSTKHNEHNQNDCQDDGCMLCHRYRLLQCDTTYVPMFRGYLLLPSSRETEWAGSFQMLIHIYHPYVQVTVHRDKLHIKQPTRCIKYPKFILS